MSSAADQTSKNRSEISHCKPSIEFSLSWESMHFPHLASDDYDLFDPLNHVWEGVRKSVGRGSTFKEALTLLFKHIWQERKGRGLSVGQSAREEEMKVFRFWFCFQSANISTGCHILWSFLWYVFCSQWKVSKIKDDHRDQVLNICNDLGFFFMGAFSMFSHGTDDNNMVVKYKKDTIFLLCPRCDECMFFIAIWMHYLWIRNTFFL